MKKELLLAFLSVAINGSAANDEIVKAGSTAVPMPHMQSLPTDCMMILYRGAG